MYKALNELTQEQIDSNNNSKEDIRITAYRYYTYEQWTNTAVALFGHGMYSNNGDSEYGTRMDNETYANKCFAVDVGWAGYTFFFGIVGAVCLIILLVSTILHCSRYRSKEYLAYWFTYLIFASIATAPIFYTYTSLVIAIALYLAYCPEDDMHYDSEYYYEPQLSES